MEYTAEKYEVLFRTMGVLNHAGVMKYRTKTIKAGRMLEAECFPVFSDCGYTIRLKEQCRKVSPEVMDAANERNSKKRLVRMVNENFADGDMWITNTYEEGQGITKEQAMRDIRNYIARVQRARKRAGLEPTKYIYVIEWGETNGQIHNHVIMEKMEWETLHGLWGKGRVEVKKLQEGEKDGLKQCAEYMAKQVRRGPDGLRKREKKWVASKGLKQPRISSSDSKVSRRKVEKIAKLMKTDEIEAKRIFEKAYPGYKFAKVEVRLCDWAPGAYIYATLYKERERQHGAGGRRRMEVKR